jgi:peptidoglycan/xylan/chitin deacetylase (PgdA/CDA1 family)
MVKISASNNVLSFSPKRGSYLYESFPCLDAAATGFSSLQFDIRGPPGGSIGLELQTATSCQDNSYKSTFITVTGLTGNTKTISLPWNSWTGASSRAIKSVVWFQFSSDDYNWQLSNIKLGCDTKGYSASPNTLSPSIPQALINPSSSSPPGTCSNLNVEDFMSQSRLTFLFYNAMLLPSSDDGTMKSVVVGSPSPNRCTITPVNRNSYWFTQFGCVNAIGKYGGISMRIQAPRGTSFTVQLGFVRICGDANPITIDVNTSELGWTFDGTERLYYLKWSQIRGLDASKLNTLLFAGLTRAITLGPISMFCGDAPSEYIVPSVSTSRNTISATVPAPAGRATAFVIDRFSRKDANDLGFYRAADEGMKLTWGQNQVMVISPDPDYSLYTQVATTCADWSGYNGNYLHVSYIGSTDFSIGLQQHNSQCNENIAPYPETWDEVEAARYASSGNIYIPLSHFNIDKSRVIGFSFKSWFSTSATIFKLVEIVPSVPQGWRMPSKLPTGNLVFHCKRPNSFAFCIDDGDPALAQEVMRIVKEEKIKVTFFTVGAPLLDPTTNLSNVYKDMMSQGHQIALHSYTHPKMEGLSNYGAIDWEYNNDVSVVSQVFNGMHTPYFRPPFGTEGARTRYRWTVASGRDDAYTVNWSVDVEDWLWAMSSTPQKQLEAFKRDVDKGGNLVVMHYLYKSTVSYLREFIRYAKASGKQLMRLDQCMMDPR